MEDIHVVELCTSSAAPTTTTTTTIICPIINAVTDNDGESSSSALQSQQQQQQGRVRILRIASVLILLCSASGFMFRRLHLVRQIMSSPSSSSVIAINNKVHDDDDDGAATIKSRTRRSNQTKSSTLQRRKRDMNNKLQMTTAKHQNTTEHGEDQATFAAPPRLSIIVQLSGEMGNHISKLASGLAIALKWQKQINMYSQERSLPPPDLLLRHQDHPKWVRAASHFQTCLPNVASLNLSAANTDEFQIKMNQQKQYRVAVKSNGGMKESSLSLAEYLDGINSNSSKRVDSTISWLADNFDSISSTSSSSSSWGSEDPSLTTQNTSQISFPFLYSNYFTGQDFFMDEYYSAFRRYFEWDYDKPECCANNNNNNNNMPDADETVFHFRNFLQEMPRKGLQKGYEELGPQQVAAQVLGHLQPGAKVAIVTRFPDSPQAQEYVDALQHRGLSVRLLQNQTALQAFCFLLSAQQEIVGLARSTFFFWAGILGQAARVRAVSVDSPSKRQSGTPLFDAYNWTNPELQRRVFFELYKAN